MTPDQVSLVGSSFARLAPDLDDVVELCYQRLFEQNPNIEYLFRGDPAERNRNLAAMLATLVRGLERQDRIKPALWSLGRRHVRYGVRECDYHAFGEALLWSLQRSLGDAWSVDVEAAWSACYRSITDVMRGRQGYHIDAELGGCDAA